MLNKMFQRLSKNKIHKPQEEPRTNRDDKYNDSIVERLMFCRPAYVAKFRFDIPQVIDELHGVMILK